MKKIIPFLILFLNFSLINAQTDYCHKYADKAVDQYQLAKKNNLPNINWPVWSDDWNGHLNWCKSVSHDVANKETAKRQAYLDKYIKEDNDISINDATRAVLNDMVKNQPKYKIIEQPAVTTGTNSKNTISEHYAKESVRQNKVNISNHCGFKGPSWSSDYNAHKNWCLHGDNYLQVDRILAEREKQLKTCSGNYNSTLVLGKMEKAEILDTDAIIEIAKNYNLKSDLIKLEKGINLPGNDYKSFWVEGNEGLNKCIKACEDDSRCKSFTFVASNNRGAKAGCYLKNGIPSPVRHENCISGVKNTGNTLEKNRTNLGQANTINIPKNEIHFKSFIDVRKVGLYKISINLSYSKKQNNYNIKLNPSIYKEDYTISLMHDNFGTAQKINTNNNKINPNPVKGQKKGTGFKPWIHSHEPIEIRSNNLKEAFYFFVDKEHVPPNGRLRFDLDITVVETANNKKISEKEDFNHPVVSNKVDLKNHPDISGTFDITFAPVQKIQSVNEIEIGSDIQYSIQKIQFLEENKMGLVVIETPEIKLYDRNIDDDKKPILTFFISNADRLSSKIDPKSSLEVEVSFNPNIWIYNDILSHEFGEENNCRSITANGRSICSKDILIKKEEWDKQLPGIGAQLVDVISPQRSKYEIVVSSSGLTNISSADLMTTGLIMDDDLPYKDSKNEIVIATRYADPSKYTFVAELTKLEVSSQAEYNDNDDDDGIGEFSIATTSVLSMPVDAKNQIELRPYQIISKSHAFPIVDNVDEPHNISIRPLGIAGNKPANNAKAFTYPKIPLFVMDYDKLQNYNGLLLNILVTEHDEASFWDEYGKIITAFSSLFKKMVSTATSFGVGGAAGMAKEIYTFASSNLDASNDIDDFMGNAAIAMFKEKDFGLAHSKIKSFNTTGPADKSYFDMSKAAEKRGEVVVSSNRGDGRDITATITLRKIRKLNSTANIYLIGYTPDCVEKRKTKNPITGEIVPIRREHQLQEGLTTKDFATSDLFIFEPITSAEIKVKDAKEIITENYIVRDPEKLSFDEKYHANDPNRGIIMGSEWENGKLSKNSQDWTGKGFTYYQADLDEIISTPFGNKQITIRWKPAIISFILYHEDVIENTGKGWVDLRNSIKTDSKVEKDKYRTIIINSTQVKNKQYSNQKFYKVDIKLYDPGDCLKEAKLIAYVTIN